jgi:hypothetical protein
VASCHDINITLAVLNIVPIEQENGGSIAVTPINYVHLLGIQHINIPICGPQPQVVQ